MTQVLTKEQENNMFNKLVAVREQLVDQLFALDEFEAAFQSFWLAASARKELTKADKFDQVIINGGADSLMRVCATDDKLQRLWNRWRRIRDDIARHNTKLVFAVVNRGQWLAKSDYGTKISAGMLGLTRAIDKFVPGDRKFSSYAVPWIKNTIHSELAAERTHIREPMHVHSQRQEFLKTRHVLSAAFGREATVEEVLAVLPQYTLQDVAMWQLRQVSAQTELNNGEDSSTTTIQDTLSADGWRPDEVVDKVMSDDNNVTELKDLLGILPDRQRKIVEMRYGLTTGDDKEYTTAEIGEMMGLTVQRVSQLTQIALGTMQRHAKQQTETHAE